MKPTTGLALYGVAAVAFQGAVGAFPVAFFAFPLNVLVAALWLAAIVWCYKERRETAMMRFLLSTRATTGALTAFVAVCLVVGLIPQSATTVAGATDGWAARLGVHRFTASWPFVAVLLFLLTHLTLITVHGWRRSRRAWRFRLIHGGLWLALACGFFGVADEQTLHIVVFRDEPTRLAYDTEHRICSLDYDICLQRFQADYYPNGAPRHFRASVLIDGRETELTVNHPARARFGEDVYLTSYDMERGSDSAYCVLQVVRQPWRYGIAAGIVLLLAGSALLFVQGPHRKEVSC